MGEESNDSDFDRLAHDAAAAADGSDGGVDGDEGRIIEWESDLPIAEDLIPLSQILVSPALASAFSIPPLYLKTILDVNRAAHNTIYNLCHFQNPSSSSPSAPAPLKPFSSTATATDDDNPMQIEADYPEPCALPKTPPEAIENGSCSPRAENTADENSARTLKRPRLVWTPQLHKRFVEVVAHLGVKNAVPKTIMQLMNVEGLTRENVASHLQKYRIYLKRMQGLSNEEPSSSDNIFASDPPVRQSLQEHQMQQPVPVSVPMPMAYAVPTMIPMPVSSMPYHDAHGVVPVNNYHGGLRYTGFDSTHPHLPNHWSSGSKFDSVLSYPHVSPNDK